MLVSRSIRVISGAIAGGLIVALMPSTAFAYSENNRTVSCDTAYTTSLVTLYGDGTLSYSQVDTSPDTNRYAWAVSDLADSFPLRALVDQQNTKWFSAPARNWTFKTRIVQNKNCNGISPGNGNTALDYQAFVI